MGDILASGYYRMGTTFMGAVSDKPVNAGGILRVIKADVMYQQTFFANANASIFVRFKSGSGDWTAWKQLTLS